MQQLMLTSGQSRLLHALKSRSGREKHGAFVIEGIRIVEEALNAGADLKFALVSPSLGDSGRGRALAERLEAVTDVTHASESDVRAAAETETPQGIVAVARTPHHTLPKIALKDVSIAVVLDAVQDPGNLGTLIRCADAFAASCVIALPGTVDYWNSKVVRSAAGASFHLPLVNAAEPEAWEWLQTGHFTVYGADMSGVAINETKLAPRSALVVGNEGGGLRKETRAHIHTMVSIPMPGRAESLNVAVATGIILYELRRPR